MTGRRGVLGLVLAVAAVLGFVLLAPRGIGGPVSYLVTTGNSMEPLIHQGDLIVLRKAGPPKVGDIAGYHSALLGITVVHRVIGIEDGAYVFKGDNNSWIDTERPTEADIVGTRWFQVGHAEGVLAWIRKPWHAGLLGSAFVAMTMVSGVGQKEERKHSRRRGGARVAGWRESLARLLAPIDPGQLGPTLLVAFVAILAVALLAFTRPLNDTGDETVSYSDSASFSYDGPVSATGLYDQPRVTTGDPIYSNLTPYVDVSLRYALESAAQLQVSGTATLRAVVSDADGWQRTFPFGSPTPFSGTKAEAKGRLELQPIMDAINQLILHSGHSAGGYSLALVADIVIEGDLGGVPLSTVLHPASTLRVVPPNTFAISQPVSAATGGNRDLFTTSADHSLTRQVRSPHTIGVLGRDISVNRLRQVVGWGGAAAGAACLLLLGISLVGRGGGGDQRRVERRLAHRLFEAAGGAPGANTPVVRLANMDELARLAEALDLPVFVTPDPETGRRRYFMEDADTWYLCEQTAGDAAGSRLANG